MLNMGWRRIRVRADRSLLPMRQHGSAARQARHWLKCRSCSLVSTLGSPGSLRNSRTTHHLRSIVVHDYIVVLRYILAVKEIVCSRTALKVLIRMPRNWAERLRNKIRAYADDPASQANDVIRLKGHAMEECCAFGCGDWRVVMRDGHALRVLHVTSRGSAYKE